MVILHFYSFRSIYLSIYRQVYLIIKTLCLPSSIVFISIRLAMNNQAAPVLEAIAVNDNLRSLRRFERDDDPPPYVSSAESEELDDADSPPPPPPPPAPRDRSIPGELIAILERLDGRQRTR